MWQDYVLAAGSVIFALALIPAVLQPGAPPASTSATTAGVLYVFAGVDVTLGLTFTALTTVATAFLWTTLLIQKVVYDE